MSERLDQVDKHILELLQKDARLSSAEIADRVGLTPPPCWRRIKRLREAGYIKRCVNIINPKKLGFNLTIYATIRLTAHGRDNVNSFRECITAYDEVLECFILLGGIDVLLKVVARSIEDYQKFFFEQLSQIPGVQEVNSSVVAEEVKSTTLLPLL